MRAKILVTEVIKGYLAGQSIAKLAKAYRIGKRTIVNILTQHSVERRSNSACHRKYLLKEDVFDIASPERNYWIGFLMADGSVDKGERRVTVNLARKDKDHLEKLKEFLGTDVPLSPCKKKIKGKLYQGWRLTIHSDKICKALHLYGVVPNKSLTAKVNMLEMDRDFWRGVLDGDGYLFEVKKRRGKFIKCGTYKLLGLVGSRKICEQFQKFIGAHLDGHGTSVRKFKHSKCYQTVISGPAALYVANVLYKGCSVALERKLEKATEWLQNFDNLPWVIFKEKMFHDSYKARSGGNHPAARKVKTPLGVFASASEAAKIHGVSVQAVLNRCKSKAESKAAWGFITGGK